VTMGEKISRSSEIRHSPRHLRWQGRSEKGGALPLPEGRQRSKSTGGTEEDRGKKASMEGKGRKAPNGKKDAARKAAPTPFETQKARKAPGRYKLIGQKPPRRRNPEG